VSKCPVNPTTNPNPHLVTPSHEREREGGGGGARARVCVCVYIIPASGWRGYGLDNEGSEFKSQGQEFSLLHLIQAGSGAHPASYPMSTGG
jgi:hypothetical protein